MITEVTSRSNGGREEARRSISPSFRLKRRAEVLRSQRSSPTNARAGVAEGVESRGTLVRPRCRAREVRGEARCGGWGPSVVRQGDHDERTFSDVTRPTRQTFWSEVVEAALSVAPVSHFWIISLCVFSLQEERFEERRGTCQISKTVDSTDGSSTRTRTARARTWPRKNPPPRLPPRCVRANSSLHAPDSAHHPGRLLSDEDAFVSR